MMKLLMIAFISLCSIVTAAYAAPLKAKIKLTSGETVIGDVIIRSDQAIKLDVNGKTVIYYKDDIDSLEMIEVEDQPVEEVDSK